MSDRIPKRIKFECQGSLIVIDRNGPRSFTAKLYERLAGGGHEERPLCRVTAHTRHRAVMAAIRARDAICFMDAHYRQDIRHDESMAAVWQAQECVQ